MKLLSYLGLLMLVACESADTVENPDASSALDMSLLDMSRAIDTSRVDGVVSDMGIIQSDAALSDVGGAPQCPAEPEVACKQSWYDDGECDPRNNFAECSYDGGDCCATSCDNEDCGDYPFDCRDPAEGGSVSVDEIGTPCAAVEHPFDVMQMSQELSLLADDSLEGRAPGLRGDASTRLYLAERFRCMGLVAPIKGCYQDPFAGGDHIPSANVIGSIPGTDPTVADQVIIIGAHHDHLGRDGEIYNGANDNASGVVALLAIAQALIDSPPRRTIRFIAFGAEEVGLLGSKHYVDTHPSDDVVYMINLDMLGTYDVMGRVDGFGTFEGTPGRDALDMILMVHPDLSFRLGIPSPPGDSDYEPFCAEGVPYVYFETFDEPCYHSACDDADRIDYPHLSELAEILFRVAQELGNTMTDLRAAKGFVGCQR